jgi:hypothetical protein
MKKKEREELFAKMDDIEATKRAKREELNKKRRMETARKQLEAISQGLEPKKPGRPKGSKSNKHESKYTASSPDLEDKDLFHIKSSMLQRIRTGNELLNLAKKTKLATREEVIKGKRVRNGKEEDLDFVRLKVPKGEDIAKMTEEEKTDLFHDITSFAKLFQSIGDSVERAERTLLDYGMKRKKQDGPKKLSSFNDLLGLEEEEEEEDFEDTSEDDQEA